MSENKVYSTNRDALGAGMYTIGFSAVLATALFGAVGAINYVGYKESQNAAQLDQLLRSGEATLRIDGAAIDLNNQRAIEGLAMRLMKADAQSKVHINFSHKGQSAFDCTISAKAAVTMFMGKKIDSTEMRDLVVNPGALAKACPSDSWVARTQPQATTGAYSIKQ
jgi:hypothetical protein